MTETVADSGVPVDNTVEWLEDTPDVKLKAPYKTSISIPLTTPDCPPSPMGFYLREGVDPSPGAAVSRELAATAKPDAGAPTLVAAQHSHCRRADTVLYTGFVGSDNRGQHHSLARCRAVLQDTLLRSL